MKKIIIPLLLFTILLSGCSRTRLGTETADPGKNGSGITAENEVYSDLENAEVEILEQEAETGTLLDRTIGKANFVPQDEDKVDFDYFPDEEQQSISLTDASGWEWTFSFPKYALTRNTKITFTPISKVQLDSLPEAEISGFLMEPDGLNFLSSPTVAIKKQGEKAGGFLLTSSHDGNGVTIFPASQLDDELQGSIPHFSAWYFLSKSDQDAAKMAVINEIAVEQYEAAVKAAKELLKKPITVPSPPSISLECFNDEKSKQARAYANLVNEEEEAILVSLMTALKANVVSGGEADFELARRVAARTMKKTDKLFRTYQGQPDKLMPIFYATGTAHLQYAYLGGEIPELAGFLPWTEKARKYYMDRLRNMHEYRAAGAVAELSRYAAMFGGDSNTEDWLSALKFKLKIKIVFLLEWDGGYDMITSEGEGEMVPQVVGDKDLWKSNNVFLKGDIKIQSKLSGHYFKDFEYIPGQYTISAEVRSWDPCKTQSCDIWVSNLGVEGEKIGYYDDGTFEIFSEVLVWDHSLDNFKEDLEKGFHVKLNNMGESAVIQTFSGEDKIFGGLKLNILFDLVHTPG